MTSDGNHEEDKEDDEDKQEDEDGGNDDDGNDGDHSYLLSARGAAELPCHVAVSGQSLRASKGNAVPVGRASSTVTFPWCGRQWPKDWGQRPI